MAKTILVTGAASGIGKAVAIALAEHEHRVILSDIQEEALGEVVEDLKSNFNNVDFYLLDVSKQSAIDKFALDHPEIDVLINNAGIQHVEKLEKFPTDTWRLINETLLVGPAMLTRALLSGMKSRNYGRVINIGSIHSHVASPYKSAYVAAKHGLLGFSKAVALEASEYDITVNTISPSYVSTPLIEEQIKSHATKHGVSEEEVVDSIMLAPMPKKTFISTDEIVQSVLYLMSPCARNITGQSLVIDGGWTAQ